MWLPDCSMKCCYYRNVTVYVMAESELTETFMRNSGVTCEIVFYHKELCAAFLIFYYTYWSQMLVQDSTYFDH